MDAASSQSARYQRLRRAWDADRPAVTVLRAREFLTDHPADRSAWILLASALIEMARYAEAESALARTIELSPADKLRHPHTLMGKLFRFAGDTERAIVWHRKVIDGFPNDTTGYICLGGLLASLGRLREAEETHRVGTRCTEGCIDEAFLNLGFVLRAQERFEEAAECFREAIRLDAGYREAKRALRDVADCLKLTNPLGAESP